LSVMALNIVFMHAFRNRQGYQLGGLFACAFFLLSAPSNADLGATVVAKWLPLQIGDRWIYQLKILSGSPKHPDVTRWEQEIRTVSIHPIPEGLLIRRTVRFVNSTGPPSYLGTSSESNILIHKSCAYYLNDSASYGNGYGWDNSRDEISGSFREALSSDQALPDVCFPLRVGQSWGDPNVGRDLWTVTGLGRKNPDDPTSVTPHCWRLEAHLSSGDDNYVWFQKGVGIIAKRTYHNGTYEDQRVCLLQFRSAISN